MDTLPAIGFDAELRLTHTSMHCPKNAMEDDAAVAVLSFQDTDHGALNLSPSVSPPATPKSEVAQLFDLIMAKFDPIKSELKRIARKVDRCYGWSAIVFDVNVGGVILKSTRNSGRLP
jgi:hypothetical protein